MSSETAAERIAVRFPDNAHIASVAQKIAAQVDGA